MGILVKRRRISVPLGLIRVACVSVLLAVLPWSVEGGQEAALLKDYRAAYPSASCIRILTPDTSRSPKMVEVRDGEKLLGYGVDLKVVSRSGQFRMLVAVSPEETVLHVLVPNYPHKRGRAVRRQVFLDQFKGAAYGKPLKLGEQVDGVSGATSSANAVTGGVRRALILVHRHNQGRK